MAYNIDHKETFGESLLFWLSKYTKHKANTLSNFGVTDQDRFREAIEALNAGATSIGQLDGLLKQIRLAGMPGVNSSIYSLLRLHRYFTVDHPIKSMREITEESIIDFFSIETSALSVATKKNWKIAIQTFLKYIERNNEDKHGMVHLFRIDMKYIGGTKGKSGDKLPAFLNMEESLAFIKAIERYPFRSKESSFRNILIVKMILFSGMRVSEAINLKMKDVGFEEGDFLIKITGKGNKQRMSMINRELLIDDYNNWLGIRNIGESFLFYTVVHKTTDRRRISQAYISRIVEKTLLSAGIRKEKNGAHLLRHTYATNLYGQTKDLILLQEALGHADINTSRIYTHFDKSRLKQASRVFGGAVAD